MLRSQKNMAKRSKQTLKQIPTFRSEEEEAQWYGTHRDDLHEYIDMDDAEVVEAEPTTERDGMTQAISLRLPQRLLAGVRRIAEQHEISHQLLIRRWLSERLIQETTETETANSPKRRTKVA